MRATHERVNKNIGALACLLAIACQLLFPLAASAAERKPAPRAIAPAPAPAPHARAPRREHVPAAAPAKQPLRLLEEARAWEGWGENSRQGLDEKNSLIPSGRFLLKPESRPASSEAAGELASGSFEYGFQGREKDNESGLQHFRARSYDPMTGRFTSRDPVPDSNLYVFVANDPVNKTDPTGEKWRWNRTLGWRWVDLGDGPTPTTAAPTLVDWYGEQDLDHAPALQAVQLTDEEALEVIHSAGDAVTAKATPAERQAQAKRLLLLGGAAMRRYVELLYKTARDVNPVHFVAERVAIVATGEEPVLMTPASRTDAVKEVVVFALTAKLISSSTRIAADIAVEGKVIVAPRDAFEPTATVVAPNPQRVEVVMASGEGGAAGPSSEGAVMGARPTLKWGRTWFEKFPDTEFTVVYRPGQGGQAGKYILYSGARGSNTMLVPLKAGDQIFLHGHPSGTAAASALDWDALFMARFLQKEVAGARPQTGFVLLPRGGEPMKIKWPPATK